MVVKAMVELLGEWLEWNSSTADYLQCFCAWAISFQSMDHCVLTGCL